MMRTRLSLIQHCRQASGQANGTKIRRVLIANRGEIACRVMKTARKLGIESVAVYSSADLHSQHTKMADKAFRIGDPPPLQSYLCGDKIIDVALKSGAQAIHPGYGFLSENAGFAEKCAENGIIFMGPPPNAIRDMGMKNTAKKIMIEANVPVIEGYNGDDQSPELLFEEARKIGFPVMIKAVCGGGGKGMRIARTEADFHQALESAKTESEKGFGNSDMIIEKFVERPRHVEVQVFGDTHQNYVYLWERDCSIQRRHQKVIEEAPAPGLSMDVRRSIGQAGANAAKAVNYTGAGTVEFIMDPLTQKFYFMEMNTRLQVEHPVTEAITGVDLVEWQFAIAEGGEIPLKQEEIGLNGHALEARVYAEDSNAGFMPTAGKLEHLQFPTNARIDSGVVEGDDVTVHYDPMIAKVIVWGRDRQEAIGNLDKALNDTHIGGLANNVDFVRTCLNHEKFVSGQVYTDFIADHEKELLKTEKIENPAKESVLEGLASRLLLAGGVGNGSLGPFATKGMFRLNYQPEINVELSDKVKINAKVSGSGEIERIVVDNQEVKITDVVRSVTETTQLPVVEFRIEVDGKMWPVKAVQLKEGLQVFGSEAREWPISSEAPEFDEQLAAGGDLQARSPMPGVIDKVFVKAGDAVKAGQAVVVMIAMKMEYVLKAPFDCTVETVSCAPGKNVGKNAVLVKYHKEDA
ncbi:unnamed protein product [Bursaphelenchus okinawaensis]|uniref:Methylcrotonoyl-CoA carboxylase subunit alpha, mitochondrial n=1 Tax=Bursaphelenchus okinawaensis TaxID=465554 RepID=A0A811KCM9_9BILA|nr:unnamed protein product [Bursaphelenchus okinawaensis]CAG9099187.1 unnamed protein product [Bursaphelenchus okinawaensis]